MPEGRPYSLGNTPVDQASINATSEMSASARPRSNGRALDNPRAVSYEDDDRYAPSVRPVSAYAPIDPHGPSEILAGRGLYSIFVGSAAADRYLPGIPERIVWPRTGARRPCCLHYLQLLERQVSRHCPWQAQHHSPAGRCPSGAA